MDAWMSQLTDIGISHITNNNNNNNNNMTNEIKKATAKKAITAVKKPTKKEKAVLLEKARIEAEIHAEIFGEVNCYYS